MRAGNAIAGIAHFCQGCTSRDFNVIRMGANSENTSRMGSGLDLNLAGKQDQDQGALDEDARILCDRIQIARQGGLIYFIYLMYQAEKV